MSLPDFSSQMELFGLQRQLFFEESDRYRLFFEKIYPVLQNRGRLQVIKLKQEQSEKS
jgi:hypothetical protein